MARIKDIICVSVNTNRVRINRACNNEALQGLECGDTAIENGSVRERSCSATCTGSKY